MTTRLHAPELLPLDAGEQYRFGFAMDACIGCHSCEVACAEQNGLPPEIAWRRVGELEGSGPAGVSRFHISMACNHCLEPACLEGCPTDAYEKLANGAVVHHADDCIGCQYCTWTCPYSVPAFQPDRRIVTKCDLCQPRLADGIAPACVAACPTSAITVEKVDVAAWRDELASANAPGLPDAAITVSTTRFRLPAELPAETASASDWNLRAAEPHWPLVWLTLVSQLAVGLSVVASATGLSVVASATGLSVVASATGLSVVASATTGGSAGLRLAAAALAVAGLGGAIGHLGRPIAAWKALRNLRTSWLSREVLGLSLYAGSAALAVVAPAMTIPAAVTGVAGVYASARLYLVPGRPAWNTPLTIARFYLSAVALGAAAAGHHRVALGALGLSLAAAAANHARLFRRPERPWRGAVQLELGFRGWTAARWLAAANAAIAVVAGAPTLIVFGFVAISELVGRWLFFVAVVPLDMPGTFAARGRQAHRPVIAGGAP